WYKNGNPIPGATGGFLTVNAPLSDNGAVFHVVATNSVGATPSNPAVLTVIPDTEPPSIRLARVLEGGAQVKVRFDEDVESASASNTSHYNLGAGITVTGASLSSAREVILAVTGLYDGWNGQLHADGVRDLAATPNAASATAPLTYDSR
ncbi:hypothetical protein RZS08_34505, partial [Arthrospira platensis SPKY1]|nr:hypothetical protein [Arthrospira platensis SPKY1]